MIFLLGLIDIFAAIFCIFLFNINAAMILAGLLLLKGLYTLVMTGNFFDILGVIDIVSASLFFLTLSGINFGIILNLLFIIVLLKGLSSFVKL